MKILFDQNISHRLVKKISDILPDAKQVRELGIENSSDKEIWEFAKIEEYIIVTFDSDFYDFSLVWGHPPKIVWIRTQNQTTNNLEVILRKYINSITALDNDDGLACLEIIDTKIS